MEQLIADPVRNRTSRSTSTTARAVGKLLRASAIITAALVCLQTLGFDLRGAGFGGIGGIAVGFAAKDLLANFFGAMVIYLDRPFKVGEWVRSPDKGPRVRWIGWRMTRIRAPSTSGRCMCPMPPS